jgi:transcription antitermination factor NusG
VPLFTGYLFAILDDRDRYRALQTRRFTHILPIADQAEIDIDLRRIAKLIETESTLLALPRLPVGARFRVVTGPLSGCEGHVEQRKDGRYLIGSVRFLGRSVEVRLEDWQVERI